MTQVKEMNSAGLYGREEALNPPLFFYRLKKSDEWTPLPVTYWQMKHNPGHFRALPIRLNQNTILNPHFWMGKELLFINYNGEKQMLKIVQVEKLMDNRWFAYFLDIT